MNRINLWWHISLRGLPQTHVRVPAISQASQGF